MHQQGCQHNKNVSRNKWNMATASLRDRTRSARTFSRNRSENEEDSVHLDANKDATENGYEILCNICKKQGLSDARRVAYLNLFTKLLVDIKNGQLPFDIGKRDVICCLRVGLGSNNTAVRAATLRVLRHFINEPNDVTIINKLQVPHLIARSIDIVIKNEHERIQALRLSLKILNLAPELFHTAITRSLVSLVNSVNETKDRMLFSALFLLCQLCVLNPETAIECTGETCLLRCCIETAQGRINECLVGCLLFLLNKPGTRNKAHLQLEFLTSVYCDLQRKKGNDGSVFASSRLSILAALRAWTGVFHLCNPNNSSGMKAVINVLYLNDQELRKAILELFYEVFGLDNDDWAKDLNSILESVDPNRPRDSWRPSEGFVVAEGKDVLPHLADSRPNLTEVHTALLIYAFLECDIIGALVEVVVHSESFLSAQATVLIGYLLHMSHKFLPNELLDLSPSLPSLLHYVTNGNAEERMRSVNAMSLLHRVHLVYSRRPIAATLFLRQYMAHGLIGKKKSIDVKGGKIENCRNQSKENKITIKYLELHIKESEIFSHRDPRDWVWPEISTILKCRNESFLRLEDLQHKILLRKLMHFYKPSSSQFCFVEFSLKDRRNQIFSTTAIDLLDFLLDSTHELEREKILDELLSDIAREFGCIGNSGNAHECLLSPSKVASTLSQHYFLMVGHLTTSPRGIAALDRFQLMQTLMKIVETTQHDIYIKLIISSLCYTHSLMARKILAKTLASVIESVRVYSTELLLILARCRTPLFHKWGLELLIPQLYDENKLVANITVDILHELSYDPLILDCLVDTRPSLLHLGDKGQLLLIRFLSTPKGFSYLTDSNFIEKELEKWEKGYNFRYVGLIEEALHDSLTLHQREENGRYSRRLTNARHRWKPVWVIPHLYGQLACHPSGFAALEANISLHRMIQILQYGNCENDVEIIELKASLWALANMAVSFLGFQFLEEKQLLQTFVNIAQTCPVLSVRASAFYCLSLIATTELGATRLAQLDWYAVRHSRIARWPVESEERYGFQHGGVSDDDVISAITFSLGEDESVEDLSSFLEPLTIPHALTAGQRASTLPPGLTGDFDENDYAKSPPSTCKRHQRSYSETCSLRLQNITHEPSTPQRLSFQDAVGLATLQSLQATQRPEMSSGVVFSKIQQPRRCFGELLPSTPMKELESGTSHLYSPPSSSSVSSNSDLPPPSPGDPVYRGICLPRALAQFLTIVERREEKRKKRGSLSFSEMEEVKEIAEEEKAQSSSSSDWSDGECKVERGRGNRRSRHNATHCIGCCTRVPRSKRQRKFSSSSFRMRTDTESSYGNAADGSPISLKWRLKAASEGGSGESFSCGEGETDMPAPTLQPLLSHTRVRRDVLKHVGRMCNPVWAKASRQSLLQLRQSHQSVFQDVCLYSSVCSILSNSTCRVSARRSVQELFLELTFSQFYDDADTTLAPLAPKIPQPLQSGYVSPSSLSFASGDIVSSKTALMSPTKNLSTVFENFPACGTQSRQVPSQHNIIKDDVPKT